MIKEVIVDIKVVEVTSSEIKIKIHLLGTTAIKRNYTTFNFTGT